MQGLQGAWRLIAPHKQLKSCETLELLSANHWNQVWQASVCRCTYVNFISGAQVNKANSVLAAPKRTKNA